jgi:hypothetical protein
MHRDVVSAKNPEESASVERCGRAAAAWTPSRISTASNASAAILGRRKTVHPAVILKLTRVPLAGESHRRSM